MKTACGGSEKNSKNLSEKVKQQPDIQLQHWGANYYQNATLIWLEWVTKVEDQVGDCPKPKCQTV